MPTLPQSHAKRMKALQAPMVDARPNSNDRGYGARWRKLRAMKLALSPMCQAVGCTRPATDVDHKIAKAKGGTNAMENLRSLCHSHHSQKTGREDGALVKKRDENAKSILPVADLSSRMPRGRENL